jgi:hypothetical protein
VGVAVARFRPRYLNVWDNVLGTFLNLPKEEIDAWASKWDKGLDNAAYGGLFYHDTSISYIIDLLIPSELLRRLEGNERSQLESRIERAIGLDDSALGLAQPHDWPAARRRVERILKEYGASLPAR